MTSGMLVVTERERFMSHDAVAAAASALSLTPTLWKESVVAAAAAEEERTGEVAALA